MSKLHKFYESYPIFDDPHKELFEWSYVRDNCISITCKWSPRLYLDKNGELSQGEDSKVYSPVFMAGDHDEVKLSFVLFCNQGHYWTRIRLVQPTKPRYDYEILSIDETSSKREDHVYKEFEGQEKKEPLTKLVCLGKIIKGKTRLCIVYGMVVEVPVSKKIELMEHESEDEFADELNGYFASDIAFKKLLAETLGQSIIGAGE